MKGLGNLIVGAQPSVVAIQSGVLVLFFVAFTIVLIKLAGKNRRKECDDIGRRLIQD